MSVAYPSTVEPPGVLSSVEEARDAFLTELASFQLLLRKSRMVCDSEKRQVDIYKKEKLRIGKGHVLRIHRRSFGECECGSYGVL